MLGDYNKLLSSHDKLGGNPLNPRRVQLFKECLDAYGMVDLGFHGPRYTWVNTSKEFNADEAVDNKHNPMRSV